MAALAARSDLVLAICPPHGALDTARAIGPFTGLYVDANAVSPATAGGDPRRRGGRRRPLRRRRHHRPAARRLATLRGSTSRAPTRPRWPSSSPAARCEALVLDGEPTAASALKMAYAGWTKGTAALLLTMREAARAHGVEDALVREWEHSIPSLPERSAQAARAGRREGLAVGGRDARDRRHAGRRRPPDGLPRGGGRGLRAPLGHAPGGADGALERLAATIRRRPWPVSPPSSPSPSARSPTRAPPAACAARARCPASSTAATTTRCRSPSTSASCATRSPRAAPWSSSSSAATATPAVLQDAQRHPVRGHTMHVDFLRVNLNVAIHAVVTPGAPRRRGRPGHQRGRRARARHPRDQHRGAAERHPRAPASSTCPRCRSTTRSSCPPSRRPPGSRSSTTPTRPWSPPSPRPSSRPSSRPSTRRPRSSRRPSSSARARRPPTTRATGEGDVGRRRRRRRELRVARARAPALRRGLGSGRLARRRARQPGRALRAHAAQRRLRGGRGARAPLGAAAPQAEVRRALHRRPHRARRPARGRAVARRPT